MGCLAGVVDVSAASGSVEMKRYSKSHPFAQLSGSDNIIAFTTQRYNQQPLIIRHVPHTTDSLQSWFGRLWMGPCMPK